jgi:hypothetical protein
MYWMVPEGAKALKVAPEVLLKSAPSLRYKVLEPAS